LTFIWNRNIIAKELNDDHKDNAYCKIDNSTGKK